jgi:hypothetical protein
MRRKLGKLFVPAAIEISCDPLRIVATDAALTNDQPVLYLVLFENTVEASRRLQLPAFGK